MIFYQLCSLADDLGVSIQDDSTLISGFAIDSRMVREGDLFFALDGDKVDGHQFIQHAKEKGARAAVVSRKYQNVNFGLLTIAVDNVLDSLQNLAKKMIERRKTKVVGITGSIGKTTTKEFTFDLLSGSYVVDKTPLSFNSQCTLPLTILNSNPLAEVLVLEMGMSEKGEMKKLVDIASPDIAVITQIALQHCHNFPEGLDEIAREKGEIFSNAKTSFGILHRDIPIFDELNRKGSFKKWNFSCTNKDADYFLQPKEGGVRIFSKEEGFFDFDLKLPALVHYHNFLVAFLVAKALNVPNEVIRERALLLKLPKMRFEFVEKKGITFINDAYNANPDAMKAALYELKRVKTFGRRIAILSEMTELGPFTEKSHREMGEISSRSADILFCLGNHAVFMEMVWRKERKLCFRFMNKESLLDALKVIAKEGDVILLKGARSWALEEILEKF